MEASERSRVLTLWRNATSREGDQLYRLLTRLANGSPRVERLGRMLERGQITARQFLEIGGRPPAKR